MSMEKEKLYICATFANAYGLGACMSNNNIQEWAYY